MVPSAAAMLLAPSGATNNDGSDPANIFPDQMVLPGLMRAHG